jgi:hypothetical protein
LAGSAAAATEIASQMRILGYEALIAHSDDLGAVIES